MKTQTRTATVKAKPKPIHYTFQSIEAMARKKGLAVYQVIDKIVNAQLNQIA